MAAKRSAVVVVVVVVPAGLEIARLGRRAGRFAASSVCLGLVFFGVREHRQCIAGRLGRGAGENVCVCRCYVCTW